MSKVAANLVRPELFTNWETAELVDYVAEVETEIADLAANGFASIRKIALANAKAELARRGVIA